MTASIVVVIAFAFVSGYYFGLIGSGPDEGPPYPTNGKVLVDETWVAETWIPADTYSYTYSLRLKEGVSALHISYEVDLPSGDLNLSEIPIFNESLHLYPNVVLRLRGPGNDVVWNFTTNESTEDALVFSDVTEGFWALRIEVTGYGFEIGETEIVDSVHLVVKAF